MLAIGFRIDLQSASVGCDGFSEQLAAFFSAAARSKITKRGTPPWDDARASHAPCRIVPWNPKSRR